jgi:hypothetical protein
MRSRGIKAGDMVQVVRDCCGAYLGLVFTVQRLSYVAAHESVHCPHCKWHAIEILLAFNTIEDLSRPRCAPVSWLRKFEPPAESIAEINRLWEPKRETIKVPR